MAEKVKLSKDGSSIDFVQSESLPTSLKKFRQSPEIEGFYRFIFENDLQKEAYEILDRIIAERKRSKAEAKAKEKMAAKEAAQKAKEAVKMAKEEAKVKEKAKEKAQIEAKIAKKAVLDSKLKKQTKPVIKKQAPAKVIKAKPKKK